MARRFTQAEPGEIGLSSIVLAELYYGAARVPSPERLLAYIQEFMAGLVALPWGNAAAEHYGQIRFALDRVGTPLGSMDLMIAAHARSLDAILVTNNQKHFRRVPGLRLTNWI